MINSRIENIIVKFLNNQASNVELDELETWISDSKNELLFKAYIKTNYAIDYNLKKFNADKVKQKLLALEKSEQKTITVRKIRKKINYAVAAAIVGLLITAFVFKDSLFFSPSQTPTPTLVKHNDIIPGSDKAILTLEDGSNVELKKEKTFKTKNVNSNGQQIIYNTKKHKTTEIVYNYLTIPRGGQFFIKLADGTSVWLNSESKLKYPVAFVDGDTRKVELIYGEAYFDVSPSTAHKGSKFIVKNKFQDIEVLGTEFNIQAYKNEFNVYTTLVEGKVAVNTGKYTQNLIPNEQSILNTTNNKMSISKVDVKYVVSWKNGFFSFRGKPLKDIARVLSRWYDVDIIFKNKTLETLKFKGSLDKDQSIEEILSIMKSNTINNYQIKDNKVIIIE
ncbi:FecR family protein [Postechiella marina]